MRVLKESKLSTRAARQKLEQRHKPYWRSLDPGQSLGYRKGPKGGVWLARVFLGGGRYAEKKLGIADDRPDIPGAVDYGAALARARDWCTAQLTAVRLGDQPAPKGPYTVGRALDDYLDDYKRRGGRGLRTVQAAIETHIRPGLGSIDTEELTAKRIRQWHHRLAETPARLRTGKLAKKANLRAAPTTPDQIRARRSTANHILTTLKAALNHAYRDGLIKTDLAWRKVQPFQAVDAPKIRYLTPVEAQRLVNATSGDFRQLVRAALLTGCRYGELGALIASDVNLDAGTLLIQRGKSGKPRHVILTDEAKSFFITAIIGKAHSDLILTRAGQPWSASEQSRPMRAACTAVNIVPRIGFHILRHTHGSLLAMAGAPLNVIAHQLGHADTRITERHYAHLAPSYVADTIRASMPTLGIVEKTNVAPLKRRKKE